jgi:hypothetical protein
MIAPDGCGGKSLRGAFVRSGSALAAAGAPPSRRLQNDPLTMTLAQVRHF